MYSHDSGGFTLIELLLYVGLASMILLTTSILLSVLLQVRIKSATIAEVEQQGSRVAEVIAQTIRNATSISAPTAGVTGTSLTLAVPTSALSPTIFDLSGGALRITEGTGSATVLTNTSRVTASALSVQNLSWSGSPGIARVQFTLKAVNPSGRNEFDYQKTFYVSAAIRQ